MFGAVGSFTNDSTPFAVRLCSLQVRHGTDSLRRAVRSLSAKARSKRFNLFLLLCSSRLLFCNRAL